MVGPQKRSGFSQGIMDISSTKKEALGTLRVLHDGRKFRYAYAGATALNAGKLGLAAAIPTNLTNVAVTNAQAIGDYNVELTISAAAGNAMPAGALQGGFLVVNDSTGEGYQYPIESNSEITSTSTTVNITLGEPIKVALVASTSEVTLCHCPWGGSGVVESGTEENAPAGVAPCAVTANYYYWAQTGGIATVLNGESHSYKGTMLCPHSTEGAVGITSNYSSGTSIAFTPVGYVYGCAMVSGEYRPIMLTID